jgi:hypothetical protein
MLNQTDLQRHSEFMAVSPSPTTQAPLTCPLLIKITGLRYGDFRQTLKCRPCRRHNRNGDMP